MPNVEIHGLDRDKAGQICERIFDIFANYAYADEIVVTIFTTEVIDIHGKSQPFLRLANTSHTHDVAEIIECLKALGMDIERLELAEFIPKTG